MILAEYDKDLMKAGEELTEATPRKQTIQEE